MKGYVATEVRIGLCHSVSLRETELAKPNTPAMSPDNKER